MEPELEQLISRLFSVAASKGQSSIRSVTIVIEAPDTYKETQVIVSHIEPFNVTAPLNILWLVSDTESINYGKILQRQSRIVSTPYVHTWLQVTEYTRLFNPSHIWDIPIPSDQDHNDHNNNIDNPHRVTADQTGAIAKTGGTLTGSLFVRTDVPVNEFDNNEVVPKSWIATKLGGFSQGLSYVMAQLNALKVRTTNLESTTVTHGNRITALEAYRDQLGHVHNHSVDPDVVWNIQHGLGSNYVVVQVYDSSLNMVIPASVVVVDTNNINISFSSPQTGFAMIQPLSMPT